jgi:2-polyprenyl-6-hydroxyphenyl methylase / 3-demethylubiquinone-9 3-methyltransferase
MKKVFASSIIRQGQCCAKLTRHNCQGNRTLSSVSSSEVSKFSGMSDSWWDPRQNPLIGMNPIRVSYILDTLGGAEGRPGLPPLTGLKALDVGCGGGLLSESLARLGASVTAIDPSRALVRMALDHSQRDPKTAHIDYSAGTSIEELGDESKFDVICILEVLEHATDVDSILHSASSLLHANGTLFVSTMNRTLKSQIIAIVGAEYVMGYLPPGTHNWNQFMSPQEVDQKMKQVGLQEVDSKGMVLSAPPFDGTWRWKLSDTDKDVNWIGAYKHVV